MKNFPEKKSPKVFYFSSSFQAAQIKEEAFSLPPACASLNGRTLLFVSDVHLCSTFPIDAVRRLIAQMAQCRADMILLGGDYAESAQWQREFFEALSTLRAPLGIYAVAGNNDSECFPENIEELSEIAARAGAAFLYNRTSRISLEGSRIAIAGLSDFKYGQPPAHSLFEKEDASALRIMLSHYPQGVSYHAAKFGELQPHLAFAGHTHGGQFSLFGVTPFSIGFEHRIYGQSLPAVAGWTDVGQTKLLVSEGIGTSRLPVRVCVPPAFHLIHLSC